MAGRSDLPSLSRLTSVDRWVVIVTAFILSFSYFVSVRSLRRVSYILSLKYSGCCSAMPGPAEKYGSISVLTICSTFPERSIREALTDCVPQSIASISSSDEFIYSLLKTQRSAGVHNIVRIKMFFHCSKRCHRRLSQVSLHPRGKHPSHTVVVGY